MLISFGHKLINNPFQGGLTQEILTQIIALPLLSKTATTLIINSFNFL